MPVANDATVLADMLQRPEIRSTINQRDSMGNKSLDLQLQNWKIKEPGEHLFALKLLAESHANFCEEGAQTLLSLWAENARTFPSDGVLDFLLQQKCSVNVQDMHLARTPLMWAVRRWTLGAGAVIPFEEQTHVDVLLEARSDPGLVDVFGRTALHYAAATGHSNLVKTILRASPASSKQAKDIAGETPQDIAKRLGFYRAADVLAQERGSTKGKTRLRNHIWSGEGNVFQLARLSRTQAVIQQVSKWTSTEWKRCCPVSGETLLHSAILGGDLDLVKYIVQAAPDLVGEPRKAFHSKNDFNVFIDCDLGNVKWNHGHKLFYWYDLGTESPLRYLACLEVQPLQSYEIAAVLVEAGADPSELGASGTLYHVAAKFGNAKLMRFLLAKHGQHEIVGKVDDWGRPPLYFSADSISTRCLLDGRASIDPPSSSVLSSMLHYAAAHRSSGMLETLLEYASVGQVNAVGTNGLTPILCARSSKNVSLLLQHRADVNAQDPEGKTILCHLIQAAEEGQDVAEVRETINLLVKARADVNQMDLNGCCVLHHLENTPLLRDLVNARADLTQSSSQMGAVALHVGGHIQNLKAAVAAGIKIDEAMTLVNPSNGEGLAVRAVKSHSPECVQFLLDAKASLSSFKSDPWITLNILVFFAKPLSLESREVVGFGFSSPLELGGKLLTTATKKAVPTGKGWQVLFRVFLRIQCNMQDRYWIFESIFSNTQGRLFESNIQHILHGCDYDLMPYCELS